MSCRYERFTYGRILQILCLIASILVLYNIMLTNQPSREKIIENINGDTKKIIGLCDREEELKFVQTPLGNKIQKYNRNIPIKLYGELIANCDEEALKRDTQCGTNLKLKGETVTRSIQLIITRLLHNIDMLCERHNISYWLMSGTLLGAHRAQTIIPWDNDGDIGMFQDDFEKLTQIVENEFPKDIIYIIREKDPLTRQFIDSPGGKVRDVNSCYGYCMRDKCKYQDGTQIDVYLFKKDLNFTYNRMIHDTTNFYKFNYDNIFPTKKMKFDGIYLKGPKESGTILLEDGHIGKNFMTEAAKTCPKDGFSGIPWYSCEYIARLPKEEQDRLLLASITHSNIIPKENS